MSNYRSLDKYYFVWVMGLRGPEAAIIAEQWLPQNPLLKIAIEDGDKLDLEHFIKAHPAPAQ